METVALVTLLLLLQYFYFMFRVGRSRGEIKAPAVSGTEEFERKLRVQLNTLEQLMIMLPSMWICATYYNANLAAAMGVLFFVGRLLFSMAYLKEPSKRGPGMLLGVIAYSVSIGCSLFALINTML